MVPNPFVGDESWDLRKTIVKEKYHPKTTIPMAIPGKQPLGAKTMAGQFRWPQVFLALLSRVLGKRHVRARILSCKWDMATCFSGVGCAENAT